MRSTTTACGVAALCAMLFAATASGAADSLKPGDSLAYEYVMALTLPFHANPLRSAAENAEAALHPFVGKNTIRFGVAIDGVNPDGSAHAVISPRYSIRMPSGWAPVDFAATVLPDGEIVPIADLTELRGSGIDVGNKVHPGYRPSTPAQQVAFTAWSFNRLLLLFNDTSLGIAKRKSLKDGDVWRIVIPDKDNETITFSYLRTETYRGRETVVVGFDTMRTLETGPVPVKGTAYYDLQHNVLVGLHYEGIDELSPGQEPMLTTVDVNLQ